MPTPHRHPSREDDQQDHFAEIDADTHRLIAEARAQAAALMRNADDLEREWRRTRALRAASRRIRLRVISGGLGAVAGGGGLGWVCSRMRDQAVAVAAGAAILAAGAGGHTYHQPAQDQPPPPEHPAPTQRGKSDQTGWTVVHLRPASQQPTALPSGPSRPHTAAPAITAAAKPAAPHPIRTTVRTVHKTVQQVVSPPSGIISPRPGSAPRLH